MYQERDLAIKRGKQLAKGTWFYETLTGVTLGILVAAYIIL